MTHALTTVNPFYASRQKRVAPRPRSITDPSTPGCPWPLRMPVRCRT